MRLLHRALRLATKNLPNIQICCDSSDYWSTEDSSKDLERELDPDWNKQRRNW